MRDARVGAQGTTFSQLYSEIKVARGVERLKGSKALYLKDGNADYAIFSATKFRAGRAGRKASAFVYDTIKTEYGAEVAKSVFRRVMGREEANHPKISLDQLRTLKNVLRYKRKLRQHREDGIKPATFSKMREELADHKEKREAQGKGEFKPGKHLRFTDKHGLYIHTKWSSGFKNRFGLQTSRRDKRAAAGAVVWRAVANEYGEDVADGIFESVWGKDEFKTRGPESGIDLTVKNFEDIEQAVEKFDKARKTLDNMPLKAAASPLDVAAALFGPKDRGDTKAALERLGEVLSDEVVQILRQRPPALLAYMSRTDRVYSLLERTAGRNCADKAWRGIFRSDGPSGTTLTANQIHRLRVTAQNFQAKEFLTTMKPEQGASPLDAAAALFGRKGDGDTKAALKRLEKVLPNEVVRTLGQQPKDLVAYMSREDLIFSLLARSAGDKVAKEAWHEVFGSQGPKSNTLRARDILKLRMAVQMRTDYSEAARLLQDMTRTDKASPLDVAAVLFGRKRDGDTEAALSRLKKVLPKEVVQTLGQQPKTLVTYMSHKNRIYSLLVRSSDSRIAAGAWYDVFGGGEPKGKTLNAQDILKLRTKVQT